MTPVKAVLFDYGMVLSAPPDAAAWQRMRTLTGFDEETLHREYWAPRHDYDRGAFTGTAYWHHIATQAGTTFSPTQVTSLIAADVDLWGQLNPSMIDWVQRLQHAGIRTGILSNMPDAMEAGLRARHSWIEAFDHHTWSHALNLAKPELEIYRHAAEGLATPSANILFLDDKSENIDAAIAAGMQAIQYHFHEHAAFEREMQTRGLTHLLQLERSTDSQIGKL
jgi:putative hydrolase of the HAD superfamily